MRAKIRREGSHPRKGGFPIAPATTPAFAPGFEPSRPQRWLISIGLLIALLQGAIFAIVNPELAGWHPYHGHVTVGGYVVDHTHPFDAEHRHGPGLVDPDHEGNEATMTFSGMSSSLAGSVTVPMLVGGSAAVDPSDLFEAAHPIASSRQPVERTPEVLTPPPRS